MIIKAKYSKFETVVFCIYWVQGIRHFYHFPGEPNYGFTVSDEKDCKIIDPIIGSNFILHRNSNGNELLLHKELIRRNLLDDLIDGDCEAINEFLKVLEEEGTIPFRKIEDERISLENGYCPALHNLDGNNES